MPRAAVAQLFKRKRRKEDESIKPNPHLLYATQKLDLSKMPLLTGLL